MEVKVDRKWKKEDYTVGRLYINGEFVCNTLEDTDRGLDDGMELWQIKGKKIPTRTAIPTGVYTITLDVKSPKFSQKEYYMEVCGGKLPRLLDVKGFEGILIHCGNSATNSAGCILVGDNTIKGQVTNSKARFEQIYKVLKEAKDNGEKLTIEIY
jgi:hypothetical protein